MHKRIPACGKVTDGSPELEDLRRAANCYYDLMNNGGSNRGEEIECMLGIYPYWVDDPPDVEATMDDYILLAYAAENERRPFARDNEP